MTGYQPIHQEVLRAFNGSNQRTKTAMALLTDLYVVPHTDGKHYIQCRVDTKDCEKEGEFWHGFSERRLALDFQKMCFQWLISQN